MVAKRRKFQIIAFAPGKKKTPFWKSKSRYHLSSLRVITHQYGWVITQRESPIVGSTVSAHMGSLPEGGRGGFFLLIYPLYIIFSRRKKEWYISVETVKIRGLEHCMRPRGLKSSRDYSISYTIVVFGYLNPFLAILNFFDSYHALATLRKLKDLEKLAFLANFGNFCPKLEILAISKFDRKMAENRPIVVQKSIFWTFW